MDEGGRGELHRFDDADAMARHVADWICGLARSTDQPFSICLSGGATPRPVYEFLAEPAIATRFPWRRVHWFFGDERFVPHDHPDSNYRMVYEALISRAPIASANVHAVPVDGLSPQRAALAYEAALKRHYGAERLEPDRPLFDVTLLGIGADGHTASLFPGHPSLSERRRLVVAVVGPTSQPRITLTYPALDSSRDLAFVVSGESKRGILARVRAGDPALPASRIRPLGSLHWFADRAAAPE
jgi:6-phosphogluconolactonase